MQHNLHEIQTGDPGYALFACLVNIDTETTDKMDFLEKENKYYSTYQLLYKHFCSYRSHIFLQPTGIGLIISCVDNPLQFAESAFRDFGGGLIIALSYGEIHFCEFDPSADELKSYASNCIDEAVDLAKKYNQSEGSNYTTPVLLIPENRYEIFVNNEIVDEGGFKKLKFKHSNNDLSCYCKEYQIYEKENLKSNDLNCSLSTELSFLYITLQPQDESGIDKLPWELQRLKDVYKSFFSSFGERTLGIEPYDFEVLPINHGLLAITNNSELLLSIADEKIRPGEQDSIYNIRAGLGRGGMCFLDEKIPSFPSFALVQTEKMVEMAEVYKYPIAIDKKFYTHSETAIKKIIKQHHDDDIRESINYYLLDYKLKFSLLREILDIQNRHAANIIYVASFHFVIKRLEGAKKDAAIKDILDTLKDNPTRIYIYIQLGDDDCIKELQEDFFAVAYKENRLEHLNRVEFYQSSNLEFKAWPSCFFQVLKPHLVLWYRRSNNRAIAVMNISWKPKIQVAANYRGWVYLDEEDTYSLNKLIMQIEKTRIDPINNKRKTDIINGIQIVGNQDESMLKNETNDIIAEKERLNMNSDPTITRIKQLEAQLSQWQDKLHEFEMELPLAEGPNIRNSIKIRIKQEIYPAIIKINSEYAQLLRSTTVYLKEEEAKSIVEELSTILIDNRYQFDQYANLQQQLQEIRMEIADSGKAATAKLKVCLPLIPLIVNYELELDTESFLNGIWTKLRYLLRR